MFLNVFFIFFTASYIAWFQGEYEKIKKMEGAGFRRIRSTPNLIARTLAGPTEDCCRDVLWVNSARRERNNK